ncbi:SagB family peptide dehydrogenase [Fictibacillus fluitans]|uniref:SagB family peptide dehydrogenase n=1 Tax=Fictibacillus fluitans TaxID=3058422 RepID=A0ABT8HW96_9BACL|nr:SagB family peptide dehydrogenase [Fictibacillus sp. NE201]MDN4525055.1 SagB family peptide dehydrogenase [Fictibacillus sp. NE201]
MHLDEFVYKLHYETDKVKPGDWVVNWDDAPLPYKLYCGLPSVDLPVSPPFHFKEKKTSTPSLEDLGQFLKFTFGLTQLSQTLPADDPTGEYTTYRRFAPSGGALYPSELYLYLKMEDLPHGIYHYDAAHHRLVALREGNFDRYLQRALGSRCDVSSTFGMVFLSVFFWKNFFKYHNFSYRLQGLDTGFVIGQLLETGRRLEFKTSVYYQFLDRAMNHLLGISQQEESVYAVLPLSVDPAINWSRKDNVEDAITASSLSGELVPLSHSHFVRSKVIREYPVLLKMNEACMLDSLPLKKEKTEVSTQPSQAKRLSYDFYKVCEKRHSPGLDFYQKPVSKDTLMALLNETFSGTVHQTDVDVPCVSLYCYTYNVEGLPNGFYSYDDSKQDLTIIEEGDFRTELQDGLLADTVNLAQVPLHFVIAGSSDHYRADYGYRGHRIQHMEAGILSQQLLLAASALDLCGHPLLGFDVNTYDDLFQLKEEKKTSLLFLPVGSSHPLPRLQGRL